MNTRLYMEIFKQNYYNSLNFIYLKNVTAKSVFKIPFSGKFLFIITCSLLILFRVNISWKSPHCSEQLIKRAFRIYGDVQPVWKRKSHNLSTGVN
jgi:hypothetical protein